MNLEGAGRVFAYTALFFGFWTVIKAPPGAPGALIWLPKLWAGAWSPILALTGVIGAALGAASGSYDALAVGLIGAALDVRHALLVTRWHDGFEQAFGSDWMEHIPPGLQAKLPKKRYRLVQPIPGGMPAQRNLSLGISGRTTEALLCDLWLPPDGVPNSGLAVIYLHGGAWQALDKDFLTRPLFRLLAGQGHVILDLAYSLAPGADLKRMLGDVKQAALWMKNHAVEYRVDPERIVLMGVSGGAHLALLAAYAPHHPAFEQAFAGEEMQVRGVIAMHPITDMGAFFIEYGHSTRAQPETSDQIDDTLRPRLHDRTWMDRFLTRSRAFPAYRHANMPGGALLLVELMGGTLKEIPDAYRQASPLAHVGGHCPPTLQLAVDNDFIIDASHGRRLHAALQAAGCCSVYVEFRGSVHGFDQYFGVSRRIAPAAQAATQDIIHFLALLA